MSRFWLTLVFTGLLSHAQAREETWQAMPGVTSARLATDGWELISSSGLSWPDGRQAVVTFWRGNDRAIRRCNDFFDADMQQTGGLCYEPKAGKQQRRK